ncbi:MAG TPA: family 78 glycoside hydrolase catalytic domain [Verrucomicrobiae bacterium]|nr:family 78 glycoside hydrolase catalytic domain [Verrucomicrobiae bacterium]
MKKFTALLLLTAALSPLANAALTPTDLRCDYAANPLGVDSKNPRLFWKLQSKQRDQKQIAYEILVSSSPGLLAKNDGDLWDSGQVASDETIQIYYGGKKLNSFQQVFWKVRIWDADGKISESKPATWTMGVLQNPDWHAKWISASETNCPSTLLRQQFVVKPNLKRAVVNICGLGEYELTLNEKKIGDDFLTPGWTKYDKTCLYDTFDITKNLQRGKNAIGIELGNGMYNIPRDPSRFAKFRKSFGPQEAIAQIRLEYADGSVEFIGTDENWRASKGPITFDSIYGGEDFDARLVQNHWNKTGFDDSHWQPAQIVNGPGGELCGLSCAAPPVCEFEIHKPVASWNLTNGDVVFDLGQNASHVPKISISGPAGSSVRLFPSELTNADGSINQSSMGGGHRGYIWCDYIKATDRIESWSPKFFYVGCRYIQVHFTSAETNGARPKIKSLGGIVIHSASEPVGEFECSNDLFNRTFSLIHWAQQNNMVSILTDCPHRERLGWLEQDHLNGPALRYDFDLAQLFTKIVNDISDSQLPNGLVPTTAPEYTVFGDKNDPEHPRNNYGDSLEWSSTFILAPWQQYEFDGDLNLFREHYDAMKRYVDYIGSRATNCIVDFGLGDWYDLGPRAPGIAQLTPVALTATAFYYEDAKIMSHAAELLGKEDDAKNYHELALKIRKAFNETFYNQTNHFYSTGSQTANSIPLVFGICKESNRAAVVDSIVRDVQKKGLTAGDVGYRYLLRALADGGRNDVIFEMNNQTNRPGYGMQLAKGKTSLTEAWNGGASQDHFMLGQIQEWFYHDLAGIQNAPGSAGFKKIVIAPHPVGDLKWVRASYDSIRGKIVSDWKCEGRAIRLNVSIPANATATIAIPSGFALTAKMHYRGLKILQQTDDLTVFETGSGDYTFQFPDPRLEKSRSQF